MRFKNLSQIHIEKVGKLAGRMVGAMTKDTARTVSPWAASHLGTNVPLPIRSHK